jgi:predicted metalloprotease
MQPMTHEHDTVVVDDGRESGSGMGAILAIIAILVLLVAVWYFALGPGAASTGTTNNNTINNGGEQPAATQEIPNPVSS